MLDKVARLANRGPEDTDAMEESQYQDICGYGLIGMMKDVKKK
jgi:hypothetical protein